MPCDYNKYPPNWKTEIRPDGVKVVLTIAHLDHDENNWDVPYDRLRALCQRCHLRYDAPEKKRRREQKINNTSGREQI